MPEEPKWKGQVPVFYFELAHVSAIASVARSEVFWAFSASEPQSAKDVAESLGKSAQTVRYHVNELVKVGLLISVEKRRRRSRIEEAYVHAGMEFLVRPAPVSAAYQEQMNRGFDSILRQMGRERAAMIRLQNIDTDLNRYLAYRRYAVRLSPERAAEVKQLLVKAAEEARDLQEDEGVLVHLAVYMSATLGESRTIESELRKKR